MKYYEGLLGTKEHKLNPIDTTVFNNCATVAEEQGRLLCSPVTMDEVKNALWSIPSE